MGRAFEYRRASKEKRWGQMSKMFPKLARAITLAAKDGGTDPDSNGRLRTAIANAKAQNMPKDNIETAIRRAAGREADALAEVNYEGKGPHGVLLFIECLTDNSNRTVANLKTYFNRLGGQLVQAGSLDFLFARKAVIEFERTPSMDLDAIELELIDAGLEELEVDGDTVYLYGDFTAFGSLTHAVERLGVHPRQANLQRIPTSPVEFSDGQLAAIDKLVERIEDDEDVQAVYTNVA
jgi:YebC/PmpR family DNA-binding regulatory protein